jgi:hypothetical protein
MQDNQLNRLGGICAILVGVTYLFVTVFFVLDPTKFISDPHELWQGLAEEGTARLMQYWGFALGAIFAFGAIPAISALVRAKHEGWVLWTAGLAYLSFGVTAVETFRLVTAVPVWAENYAAGDPAVQNTIVTTDLLLRLDPATWLRFGALAPWFLVVSVLALRHGLLSRPLSYLGIALGAFTAVTAVGVAVGASPVVLVAAPLGGALAPVWFIWIGVVLRRSGGAADPSAADPSAADPSAAGAGAVGPGPAGRPVAAGGGGRVSDG